MTGFLTSSKVIYMYVQPQDLIDFLYYVQMLFYLRTKGTFYSFLNVVIRNYKPPKCYKLYQGFRKSNIYFLRIFKSFIVIQLFNRKIPISERNALQPSMSLTIRYSRWYFFAAVGQSNCKKYICNYFPYEENLVLNFRVDAF